METVSNCLAVFKALIFIKLRSLFQSRICAKAINLQFGRIAIKSRRAGRITIGTKNRFHNRVCLSSSGTLEIGNGCEFKKNVDLQANSGCLHIDDGVFINSDSLLVACDSISVGSGTAIGNGVKIYDHDHVFVAEGEQPWNQTTTEPVTIGKNCWIGANTVILRGTRIGDNCVVGAGCILKGTYPAHSKIIQKRETTVTVI